MAEQEGIVISAKTVETELGTLHLQVLDYGHRNSGELVVRASGESEKLGPAMATGNLHTWGVPEEKVREGMSLAIGSAIKGCLSQWQGKKPALEVFDAFIG